MKIDSLRVFGDPQNFTGYGNATQAISLALNNLDIPIKYVFSGPNKDFINNLKTYNCSPKADLYIHTPPFEKHRTNNYKIGYFYWEADRLPIRWEKDIIKNLDEIWAPCNLVKSACLRAGFKGPIRIIPTPNLNSLSDKKIQIPSEFKDLVLSDNTFKFYSIFQWNERKGYQKLIRGYYEEFSSKEDVILILKVNPINHPGHGLQKIKEDILKIKASVSLRQKKLPKIFLSTDYVDRPTIDSIHRTCDAFVLPHHGEGWGMPIHDAIVNKKFIITTKFGGITEWLNNDNAFIIDHNMIAVQKMNWNPWYGPYQKWANPSLGSLRRQMRLCFEGKDKFDYKKENLEKVIDRLTINACTLDIKKALNL